MDNPQFSSPVRADPSKLRFDPFRERDQVRKFDSGEPDLDDFLNTEEVEEYERENLGHTTLVFYDGELVAYYTISSDGLRAEYVDARKLSASHVKKSAQRIEAYPALKIGRFAVQRNWQSRGIGRLLIRRIAAIAVTTQPAVRLIILNAKPKAVPFYQKAGFVLTNEVRRERGRVNRTMYLDVLSIQDAVLAD